MAQGLIGRVQRLLMSPKSEWDVIDAEQAETQSLIVGYVIPLAAIPAVATIVGGGFSQFAISGAVASFVMAIVWVFVFAFIINALASSFGATKNDRQALKVAAYWPTAGWVAGIFMIVPVLGILAFVGFIYSLYLLFVGLPKLMKPTPEKATTYTVVCIVVAIVAMIVIGAAASAFMPNRGLAVFGANNASYGSSELDKRAAALEEAAESGDLNKVLGAIGGLTGAAADGAVVESEALRGLAPSRLAGLERKSLNIESLEAPFRAVVMTAEYGEGDKTIELKVTNSPAMSAMSGMFGFAGATYDRTTDDGYERLRRDGDVIIMEEWAKSSRHARYGRIIADSFMVEAEGYGFEAKEIERAAREISEGELKRLPKRQG